MRAVDDGSHDRADPQPEPGARRPGAVADLTASLAEGVAAHVAEVRERIGGAGVLLQLDEPALPAVLAGAVPTASGLNRVGAIDTAVTRDGLRAVLAATTAFGLVHCCARVENSHRISHEVKDKVRAEIPSVRDVLVHIEPLGIAARRKNF